MGTTRTWLTRASLVVAFVFCTAVIVPGGLAQQDGQYQQEGSSASEAGLGLAAFLATIPYGAAKICYALVGGLVGGMAWVVSGGDDETAQNIWTTSMYGTYTLSPAHLRGEKPIRFFGVADETARDNHIDEDYQNQV